MLSALGQYLEARSSHAEPTAGVRPWRWSSTTSSAGPEPPDPRGRATAETMEEPRLPRGRPASASRWLSTNSTCFPFWPLSIHMQLITPAEQQEPGPSSSSSRFASLFLPGRRIDASLHLRQESPYQLCYLFVVRWLLGLFSVVGFLISSHTHCKSRCSSLLSLGTQI